MAKKVIRPLQTEADYEAAMDEVEGYFEHEPKRGTPEADRFDLLALIIEDCEKKRWPIAPPGAAATPRKPVDLSEFQALTDGIASQPESAADLVRAMRDGDRY